jgi:hypothetical protein
MLATRRPSLPLSLGLAGLLGVLTAGCGNPLPGTLLGTYQVTATAGTSTCGSGLGAPGVYQFDVELSRTVATLHWSWLDNAPVASGPLTPVSSTDATLQASLVSSQSSNVDPSAAGSGPCTMTRTDTLLVTLGTETPPQKFTGTMSYAFTVESGANCADQLAASGGDYAELPCSLAYTIAGTRQ